jgi:hypothetical protein
MSFTESSAAEADAAEAPLTAVSDEALVPLPEDSEEEEDPHAPSVSAIMEASTQAIIFFFMYILLPEVVQ